MSRSIKGKKGSGYEYWSRRPLKLKFGDPGKLAKKLTHRAERREGKEQVKE